MNEQNKKWITICIVMVVFCICVALVILGHKNIGLEGLGTQLLGLAGLICLLGLYNKKYK